MRLNELFRIVKYVHGLNCQGPSATVFAIQWDTSSVRYKLMCLSTAEIKYILIYLKIK